jgi:adenylate cyclase class 2
MLEIEAKYPVADLGPIRQQLLAWEAAIDAPREDVDQYFNAPDRDFARTDEALRLRTIGSANFLTYKGPKTDAQTKTRTEIEVPFAAGGLPATQLAQLLQHLGYRPVAIVRKRRVVCHVQRDGFALEVCLDEVHRVGQFVEVEIVADESALAAGRAVLLQTAAALGLTNSERRSYLELLLTKSRAS